MLFVYCALSSLEFLLLHILNRNECTYCVTLRETILPCRLKLEHQCIMCERISPCLYLTEGINIASNCSDFVTKYIPEQPQIS